VKPDLNEMVLALRDRCELAKATADAFKSNFERLDRGWSIPVSKVCIKSL
jgi:hypothetical protein